jgi:PAS domain S-box-containing protein
VADSPTVIAGTAIHSDLQGILRDTGVALWTYDSGSSRFTIDETCRALFELGSNEILNRRKLSARLHPDDVERYWATMQEAMESNGEFGIQFRMRTRNGVVRFVSGRGRVRPHLAHEPATVDGVYIDVTEQHQLQEQLHATELKMQTLAESFPGLFSYVDRDYIIRYLSERYLDHVGRPREEIVNHHLSIVSGMERFEMRKRVYDRALGGESVSFEESRALAKGGQRYYAITYNPDRDANGEIRGFMAIGLDITELREVEQRLREKTRELSRSNQDLEQFAYVASHDLKAPLRAIEVLVEWLREDLAGYDKGEVQENLALLGQRSSRLHRLLDDLLAYSRAGRGESEPVSVDTQQLVRDIGVLLAPPATMRVEADPSLPTLVTWSAPLEQVLRNLINNAIKHHPTKQGLVRVWSETRQGELVFAVEDDGAGIPLEFSDKVFQMFQTLKPRDEVEGSGMGLAIVKRIVDAQGGRIWFRPGRDGRGTVFKFTWKRRPGQAGKQAKRDEPLKRRHSAG